MTALNPVAENRPMREITITNLVSLAPSCATEIVNGIVKYQHFIEPVATSDLALCHFMAQLAHESAGFQTTREFASGKAYEGRKDLGNVQPGDGQRYRGRGLIQTTGRANYREARDDIRKIVPDAPDFEQQPQDLEKFPWALLSAVSYWTRRKIGELADRDDIRAVTRAVNGGTNGLEDRKRYLKRAKGIWALELLDKSRPVLRVGDSGDWVSKLQTALLEFGYRVAVDGVFGEHTKSAVVHFQNGRRLIADGVVGSLTWGALLR